jgi:hypothetical protein
MGNAELSAGVEATHVHDRWHAVHAGSVRFGCHVTIGTLLEEDFSLVRAPVWSIGRLEDDTIERLVVGFSNQASAIKVVE